MLVMVLLFDLFYNMIANQTAEQTSEISYSRFREELAVDNIKNITIKGTFVRGEFRNKAKITQVVQAKETVREVSGFTLVLPAIPDPELMADLTDFHPFLLFGEYFHAGKGATYGLGRYRLEKAG